MAASEGIVERRQGRGWARILLRLAAFVVALGLGLGLVLGGLWVFHDRDANRILPGVSIGGIDVGGLSVADAQARVRSGFAGLSSGAITIRSGLGSYRVAFADVGRGADVDAMVAEAAGIGRGGTWLDESIAAIHLRMQPRDVPLRLTYDYDKAAAAVSAFAARMALQPIDARVDALASSFGVARGTPGHGLDVEAAVAGVDALMHDSGTRDGAVVPAAVRSVAPTLTDQMAETARQRATAMAVNIDVSTGKKRWTIVGGQIRSWITFGWRDGVYGPSIDRSKVPAALKKIAKAVAQPVRDAEFLRDKRGRIVGSMADRAGQELDLAASADVIATAIEGREADAALEPIALPLKLIPPKLTAAEAAKKAPLMVRLGGWTTHYQVSAHNGFGANITVPTRVLNGTVVAPGAVFDFWGRLGEVSLRTGYRLGGAIVGGHSVEGKALAGGICAASTTLFNAALRGGFEILARQPHWYYITRYPLGLDATVSGTQTMRFRNDTPYPILIRGFASPGFVRYEIWSVPNGRTVTLSRPIVSNIVKGYDTRVDAPDLPRGTSERTEWPVDGKDVVVTRVVKDAHGKVIHRDTFVSHYHRMIGINRIGTGPA